MSQLAELQGFLSIKIPPKTRGFLPWKTWKRQWVTIRCLPTGVIDLIIGRNSQNVLHVSPTDLIVRTQSRSHLYAFGIYPREGTTANFCLAGTSETDTQKWISTLRKLLRPPLLPVEDDEFFVSVIDNMFTRSSGFPGLYGILRVNNQCLTITDPFTSRIMAQWPWRHLASIYVTSTVSKEDMGHICTIITSSEFPTGVGKIRLFCLEALTLVKELTRGKSMNFVKFHIPKRGVPYRHHTFSYDYRSKEINNGPVPWIHAPKRRTSLTDAIKYGRRISKSESNLLSLFDQLDNSSECSDSGFIHDFYNNLLSACFSDNEEKTSQESDDAFGFRQVGPCIISTGVDMIAISEMKVSDSSHVYQELRCTSTDEEHSVALNMTYQRKFSPRRQSGASVASGLYEEIDELSTSFTCALNTVEENVPDSPPPLPPRRNSLARRQRNNLCDDGSTLHVPGFPDRFISRSAGNTPLPSPPSLSRTTSSTEFFPPPWHVEEESHYLPMNSYNRHAPSFPKQDNFAKEAAEEQLYVVMSSFKKDQT